MKNLNDIATETYNTAIKRGKFVPSDDVSQRHRYTHDGILDELKEYAIASEERKSVHIPEYSEAEEELIDIMICCLTALRERNVDVDKILKDKVEFNKTRDEAGIK